MAIYEAMADKRIEALNRPQEFFAMEARESEEDVIRDVEQYMEGEKIRNY